MKKIFTLLLSLPVLGLFAQVNSTFLQFDGDDYVNVEDSNDFEPTNFTIEGWFNFTDVSGLQSLIDKHYGTGNRDSYTMWLESGRLRGAITNGNVHGPFITYNFLPVPNTWYHLAYSFDDDLNVQKLFINGLLVESGTVNLSIAYDSEPLLLGASNDFQNTQYFFKGKMDEVRIWDRALTDAEMQSTYNISLSGNETGLIGYWKMNEGVGQETDDSSIFSNIGQLGSTIGVDDNDPSWSFLMTSFPCNEKIYEARNGQLFTANADGSNRTPIGSPTETVTALSYNVEDNLLYAVSQSSGKLVKIDAEGNLFEVQDVPNAFNTSGDMDDEGNLFLVDFNLDFVYKVDVSEMPISVDTIVLDANFPIVGDLSFNPQTNLFYGIPNGGDNLYAFDRSTGEVTVIPLPNLSQGRFGATWISDNFNLNAFDSDNGRLYEIDLNTGDVALVNQNLGLGGAHEGTRCVLGIPGTICTFNGDLIFTSQSQLDAFTDTCSIIEGDLIINGDDITDLSNLIHIVEVTGNVIIGDTIPGNVGNNILETLDGLNNLAKIGGSLIICQNPMLETLDGLSSLQEVVGNILVKNCSDLESFNLLLLRSVGGNIYLIGLPNLIFIGPFDINLYGSFGGSLIINGTGLSSLGGFGGFTFIGRDLFILNNPNLQGIDLINLINLGGCLHVVNNVLVIDLGGLDDLVSIGGDIRIIDMDGIKDVDNLGSLTSINGSLVISENDSLLNLNGLSNLTNVTDSLVISGNAMLSDCCGLLPLLTSANQPSVVVIENNQVGCNSEDDIILNCTDDDLDGYVLADDCDDTDASINPAAVEICDGIDNNCDGQIDEGFTPMPYYPDADGDGFGDSGVLPTIACSQPVGFINNSFDCNDNDASINPTATEECDGLDNNCDGQVDEGQTGSDYYPDADGDGFGDATSQPTVSCDPINGFVTDNTDCDDNNAAINPTTIEVCDGVDNNCDGQVDEGQLGSDYYPDADGDGFGDAASQPTVSCDPINGFVTDNTDCDDNNASVNPAAIEVCDGVDNDCNGEVDEIACPTGACSDILVYDASGSLVVEGLGNAFASELQVFDDNWSSLFTCFANCGSSQSLNFGNGIFYVKAKYYDDSYQITCDTLVTIQISGNVTPPPCLDLDFSVGNNQLGITGIDTNYFSEIKILNADWQSVFYCFKEDCGMPFSVPLSAGLYRVIFKYFDQNYDIVCDSTITTVVSDNLLAQPEKVNLEVIKYDEHAEIMWQYSDDKNVADYILQKSSQGLYFDDLKTVLPKNNNLNVYQLFDLNPLEGNNYYRILINKNDGDNIYSDIKKVEFPVFKTFTIFPNPANDFAKINLQHYIGENVEIKIVNNFGQQIREFKLDNIFSKYYQMDLRGLKEGHYVVWVLVADSKPAARQLIIGKG